MPRNGPTLLDEIVAALPSESPLRPKLGLVRDELEALEKENEELRADKALRERHQGAPRLKRSGEAYFEVLEDGRSNGIPYCTHCWDRNQLLSEILTVFGDAMRCSICNKTIRRGLDWPRR